MRMRGAATTVWAMAALAVLLAAADAGAQTGRGGPAERGPDGDVQVLLTPAQAMREVFPEAAAVAVRTWRPTAEERARLEEELGRRLYEPWYEILLAYDAAERFLGYAVVTDERGKYRPITFMVGVTPRLTVRDAAVMVYRESRGGEVQRRRFLVQYRGKGRADPIRINRDIINISGATISVRSMNAGVRKVLAVVEAAFGSGAPVAVNTELLPVTSLR